MKTFKYVYTIVHAYHEKIKFYVFLILHTFIFHPLVNQARVLVYLIPFVNKRGCYIFIVISESLLVRPYALSIILILVIYNGIILVYKYMKLPDEGKGGGRTARRAVRVRERIPFTTTQKAKLFYNVSSGVYEYGGERSRIISMQNSAVLSCPTLRNGAEANARLFCLYLTE